MKNILKKFAALALAVAIVLVTTVGTTFAADSSVSYKGQAQKFIFEPGSTYSPTDLFDNYKGVMPGDSLAEQITVRNSSAGTVKIYMRALGSAELQDENGTQVVSKEDSDAFLSQMKLTVKNSSTDLFEAAANETAQLTDWVCLGTFKKGADITLNVTLDVPIEMGNEFQYDLENGTGIGVLDWQFMVEEIPEETKTGDDFNMMIPVGIAIAALVAAGILIATRKKHSR